MANITHNLIDQTLDPATLSEIENHLNAVEALLPKKALTADERKKYRGLDVRNLAFVEAALKVQKTLPLTVLPDPMKSEGMEKDLTLYKQANKINSRINHIARLLLDVERIVAHEAYSMALAHYKLYQVGNKLGLPNAKTAVEQMEWRFKSHGGGRKKDDSL
ncbi:hypothetical protein KXJ69_07090 [Aureisphaera sp. CAU 1614]|uniref:Uncharacterized protein n=1 Tax=Halomarinibacterium sedimenti TaxID=2857106 RepID=A0A9X1FP89_9FLAO|nr:hypothetical protein [Halomarinibacterium sedimenti]MBW2937868.1 hypothetical protein [Halomarinibacterium sedimenti]